MPELTGQGGAADALPERTPCRGREKPRSTADVSDWFDLFDVFENIESLEPVENGCPCLAAFPPAPAASAPAGVPARQGGAPGGAKAEMGMGAGMHGKESGPMPPGPSGGLGLYPIFPEAAEILRGRRAVFCHPPISGFPPRVFPSPVFGRLPARHRRAGAVGSSYCCARTGVTGELPFVLTGIPSMKYVWETSRGQAIIPSMRVLFVIR